MGIFNRTIFRKDETMNRSKTPHLARERWKLWTKKRNKGWSYNWIGKHYGYDHTSVRYGIKKLKQENIKEDIMSRYKDYMINLQEDIEHLIKNGQITNFKQLKEDYEHELGIDLLTHIWDNIAPELIKSKEENNDTNKT